ncbi:NADH dehydrogenase [BD1-7 clade bacterium]|uniref:NADH dehydrogenase n=1 Tax=BD1-7 clade bacterium TaxID=2029982 RepID=A0A5S9NWK8_9GAMM|nr:NADH dehydrogenase [BD1-7 clade bacterium]CAA0095603.1 NADH dehydrogenase [BD1-7 clade bacterium]
MNRIVIVGGGAGGAELATRLGNKLGKPGKAHITLIDANRTHLWKPRLHEVAAGALNADADELDYAIHSRDHHFHFKLGVMSDVDREKRQVVLAPYFDGGQQLLPERRLDYDYLVIAVGSQTNDFNTPGASEHCIYLDSRQSAERFHTEFLNVYLRASMHAEEDVNHQTFDIAIVGAGATGVELAAEIHHMAKELVHYGFDGIRPENVNITIVEAADRVLPVLSERASAAIHRQLASLGITVLTGEMVTEVTADGLHTKSGKVIPAKLKVWSAGVKAAEFLKDLAGLETNRVNQLVVEPNMQTTRDERVFAFGDCASCLLPGKERPLAPRAQVASQQATYLAKLFVGLLNGKDMKPFKFRDKGSLVSLSTEGSVGNIMGNLSKDFTFEGKVARFLYVSLYRLHQKTLHGSFTTLLLMLRDALSTKTGSRLKLH